MSENNYRITDRPLFLLRYIVQHTNDDHKVSLADLIAYCEQHGHSGSRHAISNDIDILNRYGFDIICTKEGNKNFYSYGSRLLETAELRMLIDAVAAAPFLTARHTASRKSWHQLPDYMMLNSSAQRFQRAISRKASMVVFFYRLILFIRQ